MQPPNILAKKSSGRPDLNWRPLGPEPSALPSCATPRLYKLNKQEDLSNLFLNTAQKEI